MARLNIPRTRDLLQRFEFKTLFIDELGWAQSASSEPARVEAAEESFLRVQIAELSGVVVFQITASDGRIPDAKTRAAIHEQTAKLYHENLLIFIDGRLTQSLWYWVKREDDKSYPREHCYFQGQPGDLFLSKLGAMVADVCDLEKDGRLPFVNVAGRLKNALDIEHVTRKFYAEFQQEHIAFLEYIKGIDDEHDRRWYASIMLNRLMFVYFLQKKYFINNGDDLYLQNMLAASRKRGRDLYYSEFLITLFFEGFARPEEERSENALSLLGTIKYLNSGLFLEHRIESDWKRIHIADRAFDNLFALFGRYSWNLNDTPGGEDNELNPDVLGYIFEKYINQKAFGAYYTRPDLTEYLCEQTIHKLILDRVNNPAITGTSPSRKFESVAEMLMNLDARLCGELINDVLPDLRLLDPACGSGAFLVSAMKTLIGIYSAVIGRIKFLSNSTLTRWLKKIAQEHDPGYFIKKKIITDNLFGVDIMEEAVEIAKLRLFLTLAASAQTVDQLEPLPNIDFNILAGNSLIGLMHVDDRDFDKRHAQGHFFVKPYRDVLAEKNRLIESYRHAAACNADLRTIRDNIEEIDRETIGTLNDILLNRFVNLGIEFEEATWDDSKKKQGRPRKRALAIRDIEALHPFHWGYEFDQIVNDRGGFDAIITNPPWEIFMPNAKEFFQDFSDLVTKKKMSIHEFEKAQARLLRDPEIRDPWLKYLSGYTYVSAYFRSASLFENQTSIINGKKAASHINLYKLFTEQCFNLLREGGFCGIVIPSGIYTDLGAKQLREMLFDRTELTGLFCFENRREIFEGVHRSYKFLALSFKKGGVTKEFPAAFMRHDVNELRDFPRRGSINISVDLIRRLSPDSLSVMEFKSHLDLKIVERFFTFPMLGKKLEDTWNFALTQELNMTADSFLFKDSARDGRLPLFEGKMIHQFTHRWVDSIRYWIEEEQARSLLIGKSARDKGQELPYQSYRFGQRAIGRSTDSRTMIVGPIPKNAFCAHSILALNRSLPYGRKITDGEVIALQAILNSFAADYYIRQMVSANLTMFFIYQLPAPRITLANAAFAPIVDCAARLICTTPEFDELAREAGLGSHKNGVTDPAARARLRAELDGMIAHLYGLDEEEFAHILSTFPLVEQSVRDAALNAFNTRTNLASQTQWK